MQINTQETIKGFYGYEQRSDIPLFDDWVLCFQTRVMSSGLSTRAYTYRVRGTQEIYRSFVDYSAPVLAEKGGRYTRKRVESQHAAALVELEPIKNRAIAHIRKLTAQ